MTLDYRSAIQEKLSAKKQELTETHESLKKYSTFNPLQPHYGNNVGQGQNRSNLFRNRLGPATNGANTMGGRLGPKVSGGATDSATDRQQQPSAAATAKPASSSILSRVIVEQKSRDEAVKEQQKTTDKQEKARNRRMFGSIMGTLQTFVRDENRGKERDLKKREIEKKIEQRTEEEKEEAFKAKTQLFQDKRHKEREIKALQLQMRRVEEFEAWEACKRKHQGFIRTKTTASSKKGGGSVAAPLFFLPKEHNRVTTKLAEETWEAIEAEITLGREAFEADLLRINARIDNPNIRDLENTDDEGEGGEGAEANESGEGLKSSVVVAKPEETQDETNNSEVTKNGETRRSDVSPKKERIDESDKGDNRKRSRSPADPTPPDEPRVKTEKLSPEKAVVKTEEKGGSKRPAPQSKERSVTPSASAKRSKKSPASGGGGGSRKRTKKEEENKSSDESGSESSDSSSSSSSSSDSEEEKKKSKKSKKSNSSGSRKR